MFIVTDCRNYWVFITREHDHRGLKIEIVTLPPLHALYIYCLPTFYTSGFYQRGGAAMLHIFSSFCFYWQCGRRCGQAGVTPAHSQATDFVTGMRRLQQVLDAYLAMARPR